MDVRVADCPRCGSRARPAGGIAYCPSCGWNRSVADEDIGQRLSAAPFVFLAFFVLSLFTKKWLGITLISGIAGLFTFGNGLMLLLQRRELRRTQIVPDGEHAAFGVALKEQDLGFVVPARFSHLSQLHTPRRLKMKRVFRWATILLLFVGLAFTYGSY